MKPFRIGPRWCFWILWGQNVPKTTQHFRRLAGEGSRAVPTDTSVGLSVLNEKEHPYLQCAVCSTYVVHTPFGAGFWTSTPLLLNPPACFLPANRWDAWCYRLQMLVSRKGVCCVLRKWYCRHTVGIHWMAQQFTKFIKVNVSSRLPLLQLSGFSPGWKLCQWCWRVAT